MSPPDDFRDLLDALNAWAQLANDASKTQTSLADKLPFHRLRNDLRTVRHMLSPHVVTAEDITNARREAGRVTP